MPRHYWSMTGYAAPGAWWVWGIESHNTTQNRPREAGDV
jgi:hypothetical protein